jgi:lipid-A-disaccharide synthase
LKYFFITGEESGSNYATQIILNLKNIDNQATFYGLGGSNMQAVGCGIILPLEKLAFMGFSDVVKNIFTIKNNIAQTKAAILSIQPDVVCLVDYAGFNLRMAKWCKKNGFKVVYYILPKVWAWNEKRIKILQQYCDVLISIFPFEQKYFEAKKTSVLYFGNPLTEKINPNSNQEDVHKIALLPGSRNQEIKKLLPVFLELANNNFDKKFCIVGLNKKQKIYPTVLPNNVEIVFNNMDKVLQQSKFAVTCSGTATLEVALYNVPQVVVYKTNKINYFIGKRLIKVAYISLPNLIANQKIVAELIQDACTAKNIEQELDKLENEGTNYYDVQNQLKSADSVSYQVANVLFNLALQ